MLIILKSPTGVERIHNIDDSLCQGYNGTMTNDLLKDNNLKKMARVARSLGGKKMIIFGSLAKGKSTKDSDLDICILINQDENPLKFQKNFRLGLWKNKYNWDRPIDLHVFSENIYNSLLLKKDPFISEVSGGLVLYD